MIALSTNVRKSPKRLAKGTRRLLDWMGARSSTKKVEDEDTDDLDFWEGHVDRRENAYEIPRCNVSVGEGVMRVRRRKGDKGEKGCGKERRGSIWNGGAAERG